MIKETFEHIKECIGGHAAAIKELRQENRELQRVIEDMLNNKSVKYNSPLFPAPPHGNDYSTWSSYYYTCRQIERERRSK